MDVPSPEAGTVKEVLVSVNDKVSEGTPIVVLEGGGADGGGDQSDAGEESDAEAEAPKGEGSEAGSGSGDAREGERRVDVDREHQSSAQPSRGGTVYAGPGVRRLARELRVDLAKVKGSGRKGRILREDVT